ncbi:TD and POZ domain-containing protein 1 [Araneus ventricosus]|uniref:TD and POZ domain-containing protein 1 n=1 Tax=Araneus ventricosus TaxID=182803 RepID=A0A4Y2SQ50_ARAVE|nr:TD and POZ domain-containing protein 1 [Araneus ventricosus]
MGGTKWKLSLCPYSSAYPGCVAFYLWRDYSDCGREYFELDHEFSFLDGDGFVLQSEIFLKKVYSKGVVHGNISLRAKRDEICLLKKDLFIPDDILTIRCRMWDSQESITQSGKCIAETRIEAECITFVGIIKKFSSTEPSCKNLVCIQSSSTVTFLSSMNLCVATDGKLVIEMKLVNQESLYRYKIFIRDIFGNKVKSGQLEFRKNEPHTIPLTLSKEHLMENKRYYLPNNVLTIECEITFPTGKTTQKIDEPEFRFDFQDTEEMISNVMKTNLKENHAKCSTTLMDDLTSLFNEGILYDTKLKTATETFPAHTLVLSARSSVFKSMFSTDMKEKTNNCVDIDDLDSDTVRQMLSFMYSDTLDDPNYESAKSLYFAADKYNIVSLKLRCSSFLKQNLLQSNCCEVLLLADKHQDNDLKNAVQDYIVENDKVVLFSDEWKNLEKNHPQLTIEVLRTIYIKSRRI